MSKILDAVNNVMNSNKPAPTKAVKVDAVPVGVLPEALEDAIKLDFKMSKAVDKAEGAEYTAFKSLVLKCNEMGVFDDSKLLKLVQARIALTFNSEAIAIRRNTMLNNTMKVIHGGTVGRESDGTKQTIKGKGWKAALEVLTQATSIRTYHPLIAAAKPEALKATPKSEVEKASAKEKAKRNEEAKAFKEAAKLSKTLTREDCNKAVLNILTTAEAFLLPGTNAKELQALHILLKFFGSSEENKEEEAA